MGVVPYKFFRLIELIGFEDLFWDGVDGMREDGCKVVLCDG